MPCRFTVMSVGDQSFGPDAADRAVPAWPLGQWIRGREAGHFELDSGLVADLYAAAPRRVKIALLTDGCLGCASYYVKALKGLPQPGRRRKRPSGTD